MRVSRPGRAICEPTYRKSLKLTEMGLKIDGDGDELASYCEVTIYDELARTNEDNEDLVMTMTS
jgi:hypothetical protein